MHQHSLQKWNLINFLLAFEMDSIQYWLNIIANSDNTVEETFIQFTTYPRSALLAMFCKMIVVTLYLFDDIKSMKYQCTLLDSLQIVHYICTYLYKFTFSFQCTLSRLATFSVNVLHREHYIAIKLILKFTLLNHFISSIKLFYIPLRNVPW